MEKAGQSSRALASYITSVLVDWDLLTMENGCVRNSKVSSFTTDTTASMPAMVRELNLHWIPCAGHVLNLVTQTALEVSKSLLRLISSRRMKRLEH